MSPTTIVLNGLIGTGSTTVSRILAAELGYEHVYAGGIFRAMAVEAGQSIEAFNETLKQVPDREREVDRKLLERAALGNVVLESRVLPWLLGRDVPAYRAWLTCSFTERVRRAGRREGISDMAEYIRQREASEAGRYRDLYGIDLTDLSVFDRVIDTTKLPAKAVAARILDDLKQ